MLINGWQYWWNMKITQLINRLNEILEIHGNMDVFREYDSIADDIYSVEVDTMPDSFNKPENITGVIIK